MVESHFSGAKPSQEFDLFISHASEDKDEFVRPLATALSSLGVIVWYDEFSLKLGSSIRQSINEGLTKSRYGLVVVSPSFISKRWPKYELDCLNTIELNGPERNYVLPIWHGVSHTDVINFDVGLVGKLAIRTENTDAFSVVRQVVRIVRPDIYQRDDFEALVLSKGTAAFRELQSAIGKGLKERIRQLIKSNGKGEITAQIMQEILIDIVDYSTALSKAKK